MTPMDKPKMAKRLAYDAKLPEPVESKNRNAILTLKGTFKLIQF